MRWPPYSLDLNQLKIYGTGWKTGLRFTMVIYGTTGSTSTSTSIATATSSQNSSQSATDKTSSGDGDLSNRAKAGIRVGISVGALALIFLGASFLYQRRQRARKNVKRIHSNDRRELSGGLGHQWQTSQGSPSELLSAPRYEL